MRIPGDRIIDALHRKYAPGPRALAVVRTHCQIVAAVAAQLHAKSGSRADPRLVRAGSLLHDIGAYLLYDGDGRLGTAGYIRHGVLGHQLLAAEGFPEEICRFASCHTGAGITREDVIRQRLPLPPGDYVASTAEEALVMYADKFHTKSEPPAFLTAGEYAARIRRFGPGSEAAFAAMRAVFGEPDLVPLSRAYGHRILGADGGREP